MALYKCPMCGGELSKSNDESYVCMSCGTVQTLEREEPIKGESQHTNDNTRENVYSSAMHAMANGHIEDAIRWFSSIQGYRDADEKIKICSSLIDENKKENIYSNAFSIMMSSNDSDGIKKAADLFSLIMDYKDSGKLYTECINKANEYFKDETYNKACKLMTEGNIHFLSQAAELFDSISDWKDSNKKKEFCKTSIGLQRDEINRQNLMLKKSREQHSKKKKKIILSVIISIVAIIVIISVVKSAIHSNNNIKIEMLNATSKYDNRYYYVYMDFKIDNNTGATLDYLKVTTYFSNKNGKSIGTMTSEYGSQYGDSTLNLKSKESVTKETYLSEYQSSSSYGTLFTELYNNGIEDLVITYEITYVKWSDGVTYKR